MPFACFTTKLPNSIWWIREWERKMGLVGGDVCVYRLDGVGVISQYHNWHSVFLCNEVATMDFIGHITLLNE